MIKIVLVLVKPDRTVWLLKGKDFRPETARREFTRRKKVENKK